MNDYIEAKNNRFIYDLLSRNIKVINNKIIDEDKFRFDVLNDIAIGILIPNLIILHQLEVSSKETGNEYTTYTVKIKNNK